MRSALHRTLFFAFSACLLVGCKGDEGPVPAGSSEAGTRYNVLLIVVDTLRADHLGCYGYERETSPYVDDLAEDSVLFEWCLAQWPKTGPAMAAFFTSTYGSKSGVARKTGRYPVPRSYDVFAEVLQSAGYETMAVVSNSSLRKDLYYDQGFEHYYEDFTQKPGSAGLIVDRAKEVMSRRDRARPYFLWAHFIDPHTPYVPPDDYADLFQGDEWFDADPTIAPIEPIENTLDTTKFRKSPAILGVPRAYYVEGEERLAFYVAKYDAEIRYTNDTIRDWMEWMQSKGHLDNTIVIFTSDHGESLGDHHYYLEHGRYPYDACTHVPMFIHHPDWQPMRVKEPIAHIDVLPTVLESMGFELPRQAQGKSLLENIQSGDFPETEPIFTESGYRPKFSVSMRMGPWKIITTPDERLRKELGKDAFQLYNVIEDPGETKDLAQVETEVFRQLMPKLVAFQERSYKSIRRPDNIVEGSIPLDPKAKAELLALGYAEDVLDDDEELLDPELDGHDH